MFGNNNGKDAKTNTGSGGKSTPTGGGGVNTIDKHTTIEGNLQAGGDIRIDGTLKGDLECQAKLIIGKSGRIIGTVSCKDAVVEGGFEGDLLVRDKLDLMSSAKVTGDIRAKRMFAELGCEISGTCTVTGSGDPAAAKKPAAGKSSNGSDNPLRNKKAGASA